ncbi:ribonuclease P protein component [Candidatus Daviesbacteria bacterium RIFCSPHIGHO2_12_FULL_37_11]|uniref:Ribonuclease P protein component n=1 Tax=Candidatus Daviesbacteria bacterium RIFCSPHIGHO2_12_FULL_37_11 TaxID=1797777 RepID=A0A1F5K9F2_9BACT|nr:MAG: ribonuclease P protein component [Candidatus Daviesbacteria bacterium RIFCSPHIGHO2_01_FULL_37_27]OGE37474.1 MAG: ribonuclease P protein component [Candidatus Daviesbacteria bacterium RIFCSPHIGHO2_12_FULL_37_11]OGE45999.1 MAG: ribonuclease P protein component [Candidatus Daviesbacteria bacterium RIFCSPLOWO2_01_FULL_37_10]
MLPKEKRLNLKKDFKRVASGKKLETSYLKLFLMFRDNETPRVGITTSSSVFKKSSDRNRARRLTSAAFESVYSTLPAGINIVALPKQGILGVKSGDVLLDLEQKLKYEKVIN